MPRATLSTKGQLVIPSDLRERLGWSAGTVLEIARQGGRLVLERARPFPRRSMDEVAGCLRYDGPAKSLEEMEEGVARGAREAAMGEP